VKKLVLLLTGMSLIVLLACAGVVLALEPNNTPASEQTAAPEQTPAGSVIPGQYIVVLEEYVDHPAQVASGIEQRQDVEVGFVYSNALEGFSAEIPDEDLAAVRANPQVAYIEPDRKVHTVDQKLPWGIRRIDADISSTRAGDGSRAVSNVNVYIIDTGIDKRHPDLNVVNHRNFTKGNNKDCNGHGTFMAGIAAAKDNDKGVVGVAPGAPLTGVKVISCRGTGSESKVIAGIDWVTANAKKPAVANMSLGGRASKALDDALRRSVESGVFYSVAAGNEGKDACEFSPARAGAGTNNGIATVAATNQDNEETRISNYGSCVDIWAPGRRILSTWLGGGTTTETGTSVAAPHVGGGGALYLSSHTSASPSDTEGALKSAAATPLGKSSKDGRQILLEKVGSF
jgi:aqualysin 1